MNSFNRHTPFARLQPLCGGTAPCALAADYRRKDEGFSQD